MLRAVSTIMPRLHEFELIFHACKSRDQFADPITRITINPAHAPCMQTLPNEIRDHLCQDALARSKR
jgi:hypothetical protein